MSSLLTKKQDIKMMQNTDNKHDTSKYLLDKLSVAFEYKRSKTNIYGNTYSTYNIFNDNTYIKIYY